MELSQAVVWILEENQSLFFFTAVITKKAGAAV